MGSMGQRPNDGRLDMELKLGHLLHDITFTQYIYIYSIYSNIVHADQPNVILSISS